MNAKHADATPIVNHPRRGIHLPTRQKRRRSESRAGLVVAAIQSARLPGLRASGFPDHRILAYLAFRGLTVSAAVKTYRTRREASLWMACGSFVAPPAHVHIELLGAHSAVVIEDHQMALGARGIPLARCACR